MSKHIVSLYESHQKALEAIELLKDAGFNHKHISLMGITDVGESMEVKDENVATKNVGIGALIGVLAGVGLVTIPGLGILYGVGAISGAIAGFDLGIIGGTIAAVLSIKSMHKEVAERYTEELKAGKTLLCFTGNTDEVTRAREVLESHGIHAELSLF